MKLRAAAWGLTLLAAACGGADGPISVELDEFSVSVSPAQTEAGHVEFAVRNIGEIPHTFFVLRTDLGEDELPVRDSELDLNAQGIEVAVAIEEQLEATDRVTSAIAAELGPGAYVLVCNVPGHYQSGMHAQFRVTD